MDRLEKDGSVESKYRLQKRVWDEKGHNSKHSCGKIPFHVVKASGSVERHIGKHGKGEAFLQKKKTARKAAEASLQKVSECFGGA